MAMKEAVERAQMEVDTAGRDYESFRGTKVISVEDELEQPLAVKFTLENGKTLRLVGQGVSRIKDALKA